MSLHPNACLSRHTSSNLINVYLPALVLAQNQIYHVALFISLKALKHCVTFPPNKKTLAYFETAHVQHPKRYKFSRNSSVVVWQHPNKKLPSGSLIYISFSSPQDSVIHWISIMPFNYAHDVSIVCSNRNGNGYHHVQVYRILWVSWSEDSFPIVKRWNFLSMPMNMFT